MITPSPNAVAYPVTRQFQEVHTYVPEYAVCNPDNSDCTTVYAMRTYNWCSTVVPCYGHACTVTDCAQWVTFSHANTYNLRTAVCGEGGAYTIRGTPTTAAPTVATSSSVVYYVEAIVTRYAVSYRDYSEGKYSRVRVERCPEGPEEDDDGGCDFWYERWVEQVYEEEEVVVIVPVTVNTYCPEPTTITYAGNTVTVLEAPTTVVFVTESRVTSTVTVTRLNTTTNTTTAYATSQYSSSQYSSYETPTSVTTSSSTTRHFSSIPQYPAFETPYPRPSPTNYYPTTPTPRYPTSPQRSKYPSKGYEEVEEEEEEENDPEYHTYGRFKDSEGVHEWGRFYDSELRKRELWGEYEDDEEAHSHRRYEEYKRQREQKVHWGGSPGHKYDDKAVDSFE
ncbi:hypothetical protein B9Z19DRAFT_1129783 [Tuber borchii]|uniref:Uncharacterized protein n=1 Tax=Tuber borchii TaxID=42251 RepID=A0A2T6ZLW7_TUBBO|nr:hypothetical protein B9Z19DRAFT_1129783 [Tuber borchii]